MLFRDAMTSLPPVFESRGALPPMPPSHRDLINSTRPNTGIVNKLRERNNIRDIGIILLKVLSS